MHAVRSADVTDYALFARLFPELRVTDPLPSREQFAEHMLPNVVIVEDDAAAVGYAFWRCYGPTAHVGHVVVAPEARGRGLAGALLGDVRQRVRASGCTRWYLNVKQDNAPALRAYRKIGMAIEQEGWAVDATWEQLAGLSKGEQPATLLPQVVPPSDDATIAAHFGLDAERIAFLRRKPGEALYASYDDGVPVAFAAFDPHHPGIYPIYVATMDVACSLFNALTQHALHKHVHVAVEENRVLFEALCAVGGRLQHAFFRMGASL